MNTIREKLKMRENKKISQLILLFFIIFNF